MKRYIIHRCQNCQTLTQHTLGIMHINILLSLGRAGGWLLESTRANRRNNLILIKANESGITTCSLTMLPPLPCYQYEGYTFVHCSASLGTFGLLWSFRMSSIRNLSRGLQMSGRLKIGRRWTIYSTSTAYFKSFRDFRINQAEFERNF